MLHEWTLARALVGLGGRERLRPGFAISIISVLIGVAFLVLTLGVYDSYAGKLETIAFTIYPHILVIDSRSLEGGPSSRDVTEAAEASEIAGSETAALIMPDSGQDEHRLRCDRICRGEVVLNPGAWTTEAKGIRIPLARVDRLRGLLGAGAEQVVTAPVVLEEGELGLWPGGSGDLERRFDDPAAARPLRILGIDTTASIPVPRVDLVLSEQQLGFLRERPEAVFLSAPLYQEVLGQEVPGREILSESAPSTLLAARVGEQPVELFVGGPFELGFHTLAHNLLITSTETARHLLDLGEAVSYAGVALEDPYGSRDYLEQVAASLDRAGFEATDWTSIAGGDFESIRLFRWILFLVLGLSFLITAFGIRNALTILTLERRRQIGVLRALGLRDRSIRIIFLLIACGIGGAGALPGLALGSWLGVRFGSWLDTELAGILPIRGVEMAWQPAALVQVLTLVMLVCAATSALSVGRALALDPVSCLREE